jgi:nitrile hydratase
MSNPGQQQRAVASIEERVDAIESVLADHGFAPHEFVIQATRLAEERWVPENGARIVAKAWTDPAYRERLLADGKSAVGELGYELPRHHRRLVVLETTERVHNVICCSLCSCTAFTLIGLPPDWYKDLEYRARVVRESRAVLRRWGSSCPPRSDPRLGHDRRHALHRTALRPPETAGWSGGAARFDRHQGFDDRRRASSVSRP